MKPVSGAELRKEREDAEVGQEALARQMDVSVKTIQRLEQSTSVKRGRTSEYRLALKRIATERHEPGSPDIATSAPSGDGQVANGHPLVRITQLAAEIVRAESGRESADAVGAILARMHEEIRRWQPGYSDAEVYGFAYITIRAEQRLRAK